jgi:DUF1680 family protein
VYVNLYVGSNTSLNLKNGPVGLKMETNYPWEGKVKISIDPVKKSNFNLHLRLPGWVYNVVAAGGLYSVQQEENWWSDHFDSGLVLKLNGKEIELYN